MPTDDSVGVYKAVRDRYANAVRAGGATCCGPSGESTGIISRGLYVRDETEAIPGDAVAASLGCGNPTLLAELQTGETVLDLGSGGGIDVLLSARRVGPSGMAYGLDMTPEMLELARKNKAESGLENVEFLEGTIEQVPLPDETVDVVISNCVVNLSPDKDAVMREAYRVLKPGGRLAISDIVLRTALSATTRELIGLWTGCVAGALVVADYQKRLEGAGFIEVSIEPTRLFGDDDVAELATDLSVKTELIERTQILSELGGSVMSAAVRARKPE